ncbi:uncharacterized protein [Parasteatoda tepidariorum]|uniref:uncharacterized protein n=1 Tax=Parasteatoda tepidariorum TaxID=114398 RepID=UPI001C7184F7|nr:uncharacterized protein LOC122272031 [Parasteatoda tepidariorum]
MAESSKMFSSAHQNKNSGTISSPFEYARFYIITLTNPEVPNTSFTKVWPFLIHKALLSILEEVASVKKLSSGDLLVEVSQKQATILTKCTNICSFPVTVSPHKTLNTSRGVISQSEFLDDAEETIVGNLTDQHVTAVRRIKIRRDGKLIPTKHLILTFDTPKLPSSVKLAWHNCPVRPYVPNPLRCFQCQRFGHSKVSCRSKPICSGCSGSDHDDTDCELPPLCINCKGAHPAYFRSCPKWSQEKEIQSVKVLQNVTFDEARRIVTTPTPHPGVSHSAAAKTLFCSVSSQADLPPLPSTSHHQTKTTVQKPKFNFNTPSTSNRTTSPPPKKTSKIDNAEKVRPFPKQLPTTKIPQTKKPGITRKKKDPKYVNQSTSSTQKMDLDVELSLLPSDYEFLPD